MGRIEAVGYGVNWAAMAEPASGTVDKIEFDVGRDRVKVYKTPGGRVVTTATPIDYAKDGAADGKLEPKHYDDGSLSTVFTPRDATPEPTPADVD